MGEPGIYLINQNSGQKYTLESAQENIIGRGVDDENPDAAISLPDASISKKHAVINQDPQTHHWTFQNLSRNGSMINNKLVTEEIILNHGDSISMGSLELSFYEKFRSEEGTMELPITERKKAASLAEDWEDSEATPLGTMIETVTIIFFIFLSIFVFLCCFVW